MRRRFMNKSKDTFDYTNYMTIEALEDGVSVKFNTYIAAMYGINGIGWKIYQKEITINRGDLLSFKYVLPEGESFAKFEISGNCNLKGNCLSLIFGDSPKYDLSSYPDCFNGLFYQCYGIKSVEGSFLPATTLADSCYTGMFEGCTSLTVAPELPATTLYQDCYSNMFRDCANLTVAPELPATTLADYCYDSMFSGCTSLTTAPELPATTLADYCYDSMFSGCTSLTTAPELPATTLADSCYSGMFSGCTSLTTAPELPATTLTENCYFFMFRTCTSLTTAPELPATTLADSCYQHMFYGCSKLNYIKMLATDISASSCLHGWVYDVASTGTFVKNPAMTSLPTGASGIPSGWTVQNA